MMYRLNKLGEKAAFWIDPKTIESSALDQIENITRHPHLFKWVAVMPDVHAGIGATIGSVLPMDSVLIPSAVGVDIGCGMRSVKTDIDVDNISTEHLRKIHYRLIDEIPLGFDHRNNKQFARINPELRKTPDLIEQCDKYDKLTKTSTAPQLGTLGGGNHFIEFQKDEKGKLWLMVHSGSRNIGNLLAMKHIKIAKQVAGRYSIHIPRDLEFLEESSPEGLAYLEDMTFAMEFAKTNRQIMMSIIKETVADQLKAQFEDEFDIHHNYAAREMHFNKYIWVHRKGATKARSDIRGIIPGSMGTNSYIVRGKDNNDSFHSCSHGAGRTMSRKKAKKEISLENFTKQMKGIFTNSVNSSHLDEAPDAYKSIDSVIASQSELIDIEVKLSPIMNIKG